MANTTIKSIKTTRFEPGRSGNPKGRPRGVPDRRNEWRRALANYLPDLIDQLVTKATAGDEFAIKLILERVAAPLRPQSQTVTLPGMETAEGLAAKAEIVLEALAVGLLPIDAGRGLLEAISIVAKIAELDELMKRVEALEHTKRDTK
jgi:hypothetical protein